MDNFKSKITYEKKTILGVVSIILFFLAWIIAPSAGLLSYLIIAIPGILLIIPSETIKNSKILGVITLIIIIIALVLSLDMWMNPGSYVEPSYYWDIWNFDSYWAAAESRVRVAGAMQSLYALFNLICCVMFFIPTPKQEQIPQVNQIISKNVVNTQPTKKSKFCVYCGKKLTGNESFCSNCGNKIL